MRTRRVLIGSVVALVTVVSLGTTGCTKANDAAAAGLDARTLPVPARDVIVPAGTPLTIALAGTVSSATSRVDEPVQGTLAEAVVIDGATVIPAGVELDGVVTKAVPSGQVKGRGELVLRFTSIRVPGGTRSIAVPYARSARSGAENDAKTIAMPAAGGAIVGAIVGGKKGALVGGAIGASAGTGAVLASAGPNVTLPAGTKLHLTLDRDIKVRR